MEYLAKIIQVNSSNVIIWSIISDFSGKKNCEKVSALLSATYPALFKYDEKESFGKAPTVGGYGLGGVKGLKNLSSTLCSRVLEFLLYPRFNKLCVFSTMTSFWGRRKKILTIVMI